MSRTEDAYAAPILRRLQEEKRKPKLYLSVPIGRLPLEDQLLLEKLKPRLLISAPVLKSAVVVAGLLGVFVAANVASKASPGPSEMPAVQDAGRCVERCIAEPDRLRP